MGLVRGRSRAERGRRPLRPPRRHHAHSARTRCATWWWAPRPTGGTSSSRRSPRPASSPDLPPVAGRVRPPAEVGIERRHPLFRRHVADRLTTEPVHGAQSGADDAHNSGLPAAIRRNGSHSMGRGNRWPPTTTHHASPRRTRARRASRSSRPDVTTRTPARSTRTRPRRLSPSSFPGADLSHEELAVEVMPRQDDEFTCMSCFLVHHRSQLADEKKLICRDCI